MLTTGNLIVLGISILIILFFRKRDYKRMQLNKIKKFSDRIMKDYHDLTDIKKRDLKDLMIDVDLVLKKASITQGRINSDLSILEERIENINLSREMVENTQNKIGNLQFLLKDVKQMTEKIKMDEVYVKKSVENINYIRENLTKFEKNMPAIEKEFKSKVESKIELYLNKNQNTMKTLESQITQSYNNLVNDLDIKNNGLQQQLLDTERDFHKKIDLFNERLEEIRENEELHHDSRIKEISRKMDTLQNKMEEQKREVETRLINQSRERLNRFNRSFEDLIEKTDQNMANKNKVLKNELELKRHEITKSISSFENELEQIKTENISSTSEKFSVLNNQAKDIDKKIKSFVKETKVFDKADKLAENLNLEISSLNEKITNLKTDKRDLLQLQKEIDKIQKEEDQIHVLFENITKQKDSLISVENKIETINSNSGKLDMKLEKVLQANSLIKPVEERIKNLQHMNENLKLNLDDLALKDVKLTKAFNRFRKADNYVDKIDKKMELIKTSFSEIDSNKDTISRQIEHLDKKTRSFRENEAKISTILSKFDHMGSMLVDVEKRINQITLGQEKLNSMETRLKDMSSQADIRIEDLSGLSSKIDRFFNIGASTSQTHNTTYKSNKNVKLVPSKSPSERNLNEKIFKMYDTGMNIPQISKIVKLPLSDIELRLHVRKE